MDRDWEELKALKPHLSGALGAIKQWKNGIWEIDFQADNMQFCREIEGILSDCRLHLNEFLEYMEDQAPDFEEESE
jgi:hypothetical protein